MEKGLLKYTQDVLDKSDATGVLVSDTNGLCILAKGSASASSSGPAKALFDQCISTGENQDTSPTVVFETEATKVLMSTYDGIMTSVYKNNL